MPYEVREAKASATSDATGQGVGGRVFDSVEQALDDFDTNTAPSSIDHVDVEKVSNNRVVITILYTA